MIFLSKKIGGEPPLFFQYKTNKLNKIKFGEIFYFNSARNAIKEICEYEMISEVYLPEYYCYPVLNVIKSVKNLSIYKYNSQYHLNTLINKSNKEVKKLVIFLFFNGMSESLDGVDSYIKKEATNLIKLIDAAMTPLLNKVDFNYDYLVTNPRKFYRLPLGAFVFSNKMKNYKMKLIFNPLGNLKYLILKILSRILLSSRINNFEKLGTFTNKLSEDTVPEYLDLLSYLIIKNFNIYQLSDYRIKQFNLYFKLLNSIKEKYYFSNPASINDCPFGFILKLKKRDDLRNFLHKKRIFVSILWQIPNYMISELDHETKKKSREILILPIGPQYSLDDIEKVCKAVLSYFDK